MMNFVNEHKIPFYEETVEGVTLISLNNGRIIGLGKPGQNVLTIGGRVQVKCDEEGHVGRDIKNPSGDARVIGFTRDYGAECVEVITDSGENGFCSPSHLIW